MNNQLEIAPLNTDLAEAPEDGTAYWLIADDGVRLRVGLWKRTLASRGSVFLFPGRTEYIELFGRTIRNLTALGYSVFVIDWRGHGLSDRLTDDPKSVHVEQFTDYQMDVAAMVASANELDLPKPWFLLGNSMGGCIGLRAVLEGMPVAACAFTAPMWGINMSLTQRIAAWPVAWASQKCGMGHYYCPGYTEQNYALSNPFLGNRITNDPDMYDYWVHQAKGAPELQLGGPSMQWLFQSLKECRDLSKMKSPEVPSIAFLGDQDLVVDGRSIHTRMRNWSCGKTELVQNAKHNLLMEISNVRSGVLSELDILFKATSDN